MGQLKVQKLSTYIEFILRNAAEKDGWFHIISQIKILNLQYFSSYHPRLKNSKATKPAGL